MSAVPAKMSIDELTLRLQQQELVAKFGLAALRPESLQELLGTACLVAAEGLQTQFAKVLRFRPASDDFLIVAGIGWHAGVVGHSTLGSGLDSPAGFALHTGQPTLANHLGQEQRFRVPALLAEHGIHSAINVVVGHPAGHPFGVLEVDSTRRNEFIDADVAFLQSLGNLLAAAVARAEAMEAQALLLQEKDLLMREVHHRVSNSLQLVRTMLGLQARTAPEETREQLDRAAGRIMSIAAVHRRLYEGGSVTDGDVVLYLTGLLDDLREMIADIEGRSIELDAAPMTLPADSLTPLGLIVSELVTNAVKHGQGRIRVKVARTGDGVEVSVEDGGAGFAPGWEEAGRRGLGIRLVTSLAKGDPKHAIRIDREADGGRVVVVLKV